MFCSRLVHPSMVRSFFLIFFSLKENCYWQIVWGKSKRFSLPPPGCGRRSKDNDRKRIKVDAAAAFLWAHLTPCEWSWSFTAASCWSAGRTRQRRALRCLQGLLRVGVRCQCAAAFACERPAASLLSQPQLDCSPSTRFSRFHIYKAVAAKHREIWSFISDTWDLLSFPRLCLFFSFYCACGKTAAIFDWSLKTTMCGAWIRFLGFKMSVFRSSQRFNRLT